MTVRMPRSFGLADGLEPERAGACRGSISTSCSLAVPQAVEELDGAEHREVAEALAVSSNSLVGPGKSSRLSVATRVVVAASAALLVVGQLA